MPNGVSAPGHVSPFFVPINGLTHLAESAMRATFPPAIVGGCPAEIWPPFEQLNSVNDAASDAHRSQIRTMTLFIRVGRYSHPPNVLIAPTKVRRFEVPLTLCDQSRKMSTRVSYRATGARSGE